MNSNTVSIRHRLIGFLGIGSLLFAPLLSAEEHADKVAGLLEVVENFREEPIITFAPRAGL